MFNPYSFYSVGTIYPKQRVSSAHPAAYIFLAILRFGLKHRSIRLFCNFLYGNRENSVQKDFDIFDFHDVKTFHTPRRFYRQLIQLFTRKNDRSVHVAKTYQFLFKLKMLSLAISLLDYYLKNYKTLWNIWTYPTAV